MAKVTLAELEEQKRLYFSTIKYRMCEYRTFDYSILSNILYLRRPGRSNSKTYNDIIIMADTETSKKNNGTEHNHVVVWTISLRAYGHNIVTLYGRTPSEFTDCVSMICSAMRGHYTIIYFHNLSYDYVFLRKFLFRDYGYPDKQLNTKSHYPVCLTWEEGLIIKDSLILAQRSLEKWAEDMDVQHKKSVGKWDYDLLRDQNTPLSEDELEYIEHDTLAGVECIDALMHQLHKRIHTMPYTATGIPREAVRKIAKKNRGRKLFESAALTFDQYRIAEMVYHGGYTHANRHEIGYINPAVAYDFASSYPFVMLSEKYPMEKFMRISDCSPEEVLHDSEDTAFMFRLVLVRPRLKNDLLPMPALQLSKCVKTINAISDNGRILCAEYASIYLTEADLEVIMQQYDFDVARCVEVYAAHKDYLPRWFTDYVYKCFTDKTMLKGGDPVAYALAKATVNSLYGMCVQKSIRDELTEDFESGEYEALMQDPEELYQKYLDNKNSILLYQWGVWVTAYAFRNLFRLGSCVKGTWLYSDTDSCYATEWDQDRVDAYNQSCKEKLLANGYGAVVKGDREYWLGVAELDGVYSEFKTAGAKRYCGRKDGKLRITVAGVPKNGAECLKDDINNFHKGMIFDGVTTGKLTHKYIYVDDIYFDKNGNETGDSVDLTPCDYLLDTVNKVDWEMLDTEEIYLQIYE